MSDILQPEKPRSNLAYYLLATLISVLLLPAIFLLLLVFDALPRLPLPSWMRMVLFFAMLALVPLGAGWGLGKFKKLPETLFKRYLPLIAPFLLLALLASIPGAFSEITKRSWGFVLFVILAATAFLTYFGYCITFAVSSRKQLCTRRKQGLLRLGSMLLLCCVIPVAVWVAFYPEILPDSEEPSVGHGVNTWQYMPFVSNNKLAALDAPSNLAIHENHPRLDGAIALLPLYGAAAQATYQEINAEQSLDVVQCNNTPAAYKRLSDGEADIFFGLAPSEEQTRYAQSQSVSLQTTPVGYDAFVFFVHKDNPVQNLTLEQIRNIYSRKLTNWRQLGGADEDILAFQRPANSGSQTTMEEVVMRGRKMTKPLREEFYEGMGDIVLGVAAYRNRLNAIGYSFRWYATEQYAHPDIRLLSIDGVAPTPENIANGSYPLSVPLLAVTARPLSPESRQLIDWITGPEGQTLVSRTGYIPLNTRGDR